MSVEWRILMSGWMWLSGRGGVHILRRRDGFVAHLNDAKVGDGDEPEGHDHHEELREALVRMGSESQRRVEHTMDL